MAYAALVFLDQELEQLLPKHDEYIHLYEKKHMESLYSNVVILQKILENFPGNSNMIKHLESRITDVAYKVIDIISWGISEEKHQTIFESCIKTFDSIVEYAEDIRKVLEMKTNILGHDSPMTSSSSTVAAPGGKNTTVGLDADLSEIKQRIFGRNSALQVIPITGMGGIGKTTLAKNVYEDPAIVAHFDVRSWVTVSQEHNTEKILKDILGGLRDAAEPLIVGVHKKLIGRRFLIVIDDIWDVEAWDSVRNAFPDGNKGSRVIITTRLTEVATKVSSSSPLHEMELMNQFKSWVLFQKEVFGQELCPPRLEDVGKIISKNCKGLPFAIVVIARILKLDFTQHYWVNFATNMNEAMAKATHDDQVMGLLSLSYYNLPPHLKACFLYASMYPEDCQICTRKLKWQWVADGFLKPSRDKSVEEVAENCLVDLVDRNMLFVGRKGSNGRIKTCTVHDLLRDLSLKIAKEDKFSQQIITLKMGKTKYMPWFNDETYQVMVNRRCVIVSSPPILRFFQDDETKYGYAYSLTIHNDVSHKDLLPTIRSNLLRVLNSFETTFSSLIVFGGNLRYLSFSYSGDIDEFSAVLANIRKLKNLETLIMKHTFISYQNQFPILEMPKLKHFVVKSAWGCYCLIDNHNQAAMSNSTSNKSLLQTLSGVADFEFTTDAIKIFANLVNLRIEYYLLKPACLNNLVGLHQLEELTLTGKISLSPTNITFPDKLKKMTCYGVTISWETMSVIGSLPNLEVLKLDNCRFQSREWEPVEGEFQQLKYLRLHAISLEHWIVESSHFPCLEQLILKLCLVLKELPAEIGEIESLQILDIQDCPYRIRASARKIQEVQQEYGNYQLQLYVN